MARRYKPGYDWRGIAMLTTQLGQLFEPSKAKLMSQQQEHEMNILMAKQAWKTQSEELTLLKTQLKDIDANIEIYSNKLIERDIPELVSASTRDEANPPESAEIFDNTSGKRLSELNSMAKEYQAMITEKNSALSDMKLYNSHAILGEGFSKRMTSKPGAKDQKEYDVLAESDGIPGLSYKEKQKALSMYLKDTDQVLNEDDKDYATGIDQKIWNGTDYENLKVKPEGVAFISGYNSTLGKEAIAKQKLAAGTKDSGRPSPADMEDKYVIQLLNQNNARIEQINNKYSGKPDKGTLAEHLAFNQFGEFYALESARGKGWTNLEIADYVASKNGLRDVLKEIRKRPNLNIPADKLGVKHALSHTINVTDNPSTYKMFEKAKISSDILYARILMKEGDDRYIEMVTSYEDIMKGDKAFTEDARQTGLNIILNWVNE
jgi:hypothetical protein